MYPPVSCVSCRGGFNPELYAIVDVAERPDLVERIKDDILHTAICPHCGTVVAFGLPVLVYRAGRPVPVIFSPAPGSDPSQAQGQGSMLIGQLERQLGPAWDDRLARAVYTVDREELRVVVDLNPDLLPGGRDPALRLAMDQYVHSDTWEEARRAVQTHQVLVSREAEVVLGDGAERARQTGYPEEAAILAEHLAVLQDVRAHGLDAAFARKTDGSGHTVKTGHLKTGH
jgi:hypothetical protein